MFLRSKAVRPLLLIAFLFALQMAPLQAGNGPVFVQNKGQWPSHVRYQALTPAGALFVEDHGLTYVLRAEEQGHEHAEGHHDGGHFHDHVVRVRFEGGTVPSAEPFAPEPGYVNYFLGNDPQQWGTRCGRSRGVLLRGVYPGIDLRIDGRNGLKLDWLVAPGADPDAIVLHYEGQSDLLVDDAGRIVVGTTAGGFTESAPVAFHGDPGHEVPCRAVRTGDRVRFTLPAGYDPAQALTIDPNIRFSSYSGSTADNFGYTATYDAHGCLYGGGSVFGIGYPHTSGVVQPAFGGGTVDAGISKWSSDGGQLIWSTYLGGARNETPHSMVVNSAGELFVMGATGSFDMPTTPGCHDASFAGGDTISGWSGVNGGYGFVHLAGSDIFVARLSADATSLLGATYVGGTGNDGLNNLLPLAYNYGDAFRGEIALDAQEWPVVSTSTQSQDISVSPNAPFPTYRGGAQDAYFFRMDPALTTLQATFYGGSEADCGFGVQFDSQGRIFFTGATTSSDVPMAGTPLQNVFAGSTDGYIARFSGTLQTLQASTYLGTAARDASYFVQLDNDDEVYVHGQTKGDYPISPGKYGTPGGSRFIHKLNNNLSTSIWSTVIGSGNNLEDISPTAFLVTDCDQIYLSGWGGGANNNAVPNFSTTNGLPVTADAFQATTDGRDFHLMVLDAEAAALNYATFFGGHLSSEHVDGGTSRFDKNGTVYQAVCAGCGNNGDDYPTTPGAWSQTNGSTNCNLGVFKFNLTSPAASIAIDGPAHVCLPDAQAQFLNQSSGGNHFTWNFGDGTGSPEEDPVHIYTTAGVYVVRMILSDDDLCTLDDTAYVQITVVDPFDATIDPVDPTCPGQTVQLQAHGGHTYLWTPASGLNDAQSAAPQALIDSAITYTVTVTDLCGTQEVSVPITLDVPTTTIYPTQRVCLGGSVQLQATGGTSYTWSPSQGLSDPNSATPTATPLDTVTYHVEVRSAAGCTAVDSVLIIVQMDVPIPLVTDTTICKGTEATLIAAGGDTYSWALNGSTGSSLTVTPIDHSSYSVVVTNACGASTGQGEVIVSEVLGRAWPDTTVCPGAPLALHASGGEHYDWSAGAVSLVSGGADAMVMSAQATVHSVLITDSIGCVDTAHVTVMLFPQPEVFAGFDVAIDHGRSTYLQAIGDGRLRWTPAESLSCDSCAGTWASPLTSTTYAVELEDGNGCKAIDEVIVLINASLWVPNTFTPNGDGLNDVFRPFATEVKLVRFAVYDRWGMEIFSTQAPNGTWDGTFGGRPAVVDTYVWTAEMEALTGERRRAMGHVTLVR